MAIYTSGDWYVKAGREEEFAKKWRELTEISLAEIEPGARVVLLCDREDPLHFRSFGEFRNEEAIIRWRDGSHLGESLAQLADMLEHAETSVFGIAEALGVTDLR